jgi:hypothetical protein
MFLSVESLVMAMVLFAVAVVLVGVFALTERWQRAKSGGGRRQGRLRMASGATDRSDGYGVGLLIRIEGQGLWVNVSGNGETHSPSRNGCPAEVPACVREGVERRAAPGDDGAAGMAKQPSSVALYLELLRDECPLVRRYAARALAQMGAQAHEAAATVHDKARDDKGPGVRAVDGAAGAKTDLQGAMPGCVANDFFG